MTLLWVFGIITGAVAALLGYVGWRDRRRLSSADDDAAARGAAADAHRSAAGAQSVTAARRIQDVNGHG